MLSRTDTPRAVVLAIAASLAGLLVPGMPVVSLPIVAMALAYLWVSGHRTLALAAVVVSSGVIGVVDIPTAGMVAITMLAAGPVVVQALRNRSPLLVGAVLSIVVFGALVGAQAVSARLAGSTLSAEIARSASEALDLVSESMGSRGADLDAIERLIVETWPATNLQVSAVAALLAVVMAGRGAAAGGTQVNRFPRFAVLDLGVHALWLPVLAVTLLAVSRLSGGGAMETVALNALLASRVPLALQGFGVFGATYERMGLKRGGRALGYTIALFVELTTYAISFVGLIDFWANFRKLPRDGAPETPMSLDEPGPSA